jgi:NAD-dependent dihydropyrimidine dehydrogenase PreA subunit
MNLYQIPNAELVRTLHIGINDYPHSPLALCVNDVKAVSHRFKNWGVADAHRTMILNREATAANFKGAMIKLVDDTPPLGLAVFNYSGHGSNVACKNEADGKMEIMCPVDVKDFGETNSVTDDFFASVIERATAKRVTLFALIDCCNAGDLSRELQTEADADLTVRYIKLSDAPLASCKNRRFSKDENRAIVMLGGCESYELSYEYSRVKLGVLTWAFLELTKAQNAPARLTPKKLHASVRKKVSGAFPEQHPVLEGNPALFTKPLFTPMFTQGF